MFVRQYFVEPPLTGAAVGNLLWYFYTTVAQLESANFVDSSLQNPTNSVRFDGKYLLTAVFKSCHKVSI